MDGIISSQLQSKRSFLDDLVVQGVHEIIISDFYDLRLGILVIIVLLFLLNIANDYLSVFIYRYGLHLSTLHAQSSHFLEVFWGELDEHVLLAADWATCADLQPFSEAEEVVLMVALHSKNWALFYDGQVADWAVLLAFCWDGFHVVLLCSWVDLYCQVSAFAATLLTALNDAGDELFTETFCAARLSHYLCFRTNLQEGQLLNNQFLCFLQRLLRTAKLTRNRPILYLFRKGCHFRTHSFNQVILLVYGIAV